MEQQRTESPVMGGRTRSESMARPRTESMASVGADIYIDAFREGSTVMDDNINSVSLFGVGLSKMLRSMTQQLQSLTAGKSFAEDNITDIRDILHASNKSTEKMMKEIEIQKNLTQDLISMDGGGGGGGRGGGGRRTPGPSDGSVNIGIDFTDFQHGDYEFKRTEEPLRPSEKYTALPLMDFEDHRTHTAKVRHVTNEEFEAMRGYVQRQIKDALVESSETSKIPDMKITAIDTLCKRLAATVGEIFRGQEVLQKAQNAQIRTIETFLVDQSSILEQLNTNIETVQKSQVEMADRFSKIEQRMDFLFYGMHDSTKIEGLHKVDAGGPGLLSGTGLNKATTVAQSDLGMESSTEILQESALDDDSLSLTKERTDSVSSETKSLGGDAKEGNRSRTSSVDKKSSKKDAKSKKKKKKKSKGEEEETVVEAVEDPEGPTEEELAKMAAKEDFEMRAGKGLVKRLLDLEFQVNSEVSHDIRDLRRVDSEVQTKHDDLAMIVHDMDSNLREAFMEEIEKATIMILRRTPFIESCMELRDEWSAFASDAAYSIKALVGSLAEEGKKLDLVGTDFEVTHNSDSGPVMEDDEHALTLDMLARDGETGERISAFLSNILKLYDHANYSLQYFEPRDTEKQTLQMLQQPLTDLVERSEALLEVLPPELRNGVESVDPMHHTRKIILDLKGKLDVSFLRVPDGAPNMVTRLHDLCESSNAILDKGVPIMALKRRIDHLETQKDLKEFSTRIDEEISTVKTKLETKADEQYVSGELQRRVQTIELQKLREIIFKQLDTVRSSKSEGGGGEGGASMGLVTNIENSIKDLQNAFLDMKNDKSRLKREEVQEALAALVHEVKTMRNSTIDQVTLAQLLRTKASQAEMESLVNALKGSISDLHGHIDKSINGGFAPSGIPSHLAAQMPLEAPQQGAYNRNGPDFSQHANRATPDSSAMRPMSVPASNGGIMGQGIGPANQQVNNVNHHHHHHHGGQAPGQGTTAASTKCLLCERPASPEENTRFRRDLTPKYRPASPPPRHGAQPLLIGSKTLVGHSTGPRPGSSADAVDRSDRSMGFSRSVDNMGGDVAAGLSLEGDSLSRASTGQGARPRPQELPPLPGGVPIEKSLETAKLRKLNAHRREERIRSAVGGGGPH